MTRVLVVDDAAVDRRLVGGLLEAGDNIAVDYAEHGVDALERIIDRMPDAVLTDLQMPEMNGLQLVKRIRIDYPGLPVVLMTAHGSEQLAVEALQQGAASYVPKAQLKQHLVDTIERVVAVSRSQRTSQRLTEWLTGVTYQFALENDQSLIDPLVDLAVDMISSLQLSDATGCIRSGVALREALHNALYRGNLEIGYDELEQARERLLLGERIDLVAQRRQQPPYNERRIHVQLSFDRQQASFCVRDEGRGFDVARLPAPDDPGTFDDVTGRGVVLMRTFMDDIHYNPTGNEITMVKHRDEPVAEMAAVGVM